AIIRLNYPIESRGRVTGRLRQWSAGTFLVATIAVARLLDHAGNWAVIRGVLAAAALFQTGPYLAGSRVRVRPDPPPDDGDDAPDLTATARSAASELRRDARFLRYLAGCFLFGLSALTYDPIVRAYFSDDLGLNYTQCVVLADSLPTVCSVLTVHRLGA